MHPVLSGFGVWKSSYQHKYKVFFWLLLLLNDRLSIRIFSEEKNMDLPSYESESFKRQLAVPFYMEIIILM